MKNFPFFFLLCAVFSWLSGAISSFTVAADDLRIPGTADLTLLALPGKELQYGIGHTGQTQKEISIKNKLIPARSVKAEPKDPLPAAPVLRNE